MNIKYNYLHGNDKELTSNYNIDTRPDPDIDGCKKLYDDIVEAYFIDGIIQKKDIEVLEQQFKYNKQYAQVSNKELWQRYFSLNNTNPQKESAIYKPPFYTIIYKKEFYLSSDYIGPSIYWAKQKGMTQEQQINILNKCRTIGGHIVWPRGNGTTINQARSGKKSFYDRIDWTLFLIKQFCDNEFDICKTDEVCENMFGINNINHIKKVLVAINTYQKWFKEFGHYNVAFKNFCKQFKLVGCFVNQEYDINWLAPPIPFLPNNYDLFVENSIIAIEKRNKLLK